MNSKLITESDKFFWHGYIQFYEKFFVGRDFKSIAELGVFKGNSIRWLLERFPNSHICAADILPQQASWPVDPRVRYFNLDQGNRSQVIDFYHQAEFDLIIEDGSHIPEHQSSCLIEGMKRLMPGGLYILEDIHTSLNYSTGNALTVLLAIDHYHRIQKNIDQTLALEISKQSLMSAEDVFLLAKQIKNVSLYRRTHLPNSCYNCGSTEFLYSQMKCVCGVDVFSNNDSMSFVIEKHDT
jgi:predicted O-methyltransferase YrrM